MATQTAESAKHMEAIMTPYEFGILDLATILSFLKKFRRACDSSGVSENVAM